MEPNYNFHLTHHVRPFHIFVPPQLTYAGCNAESITNVVPFKIPRTLYHLFFLHFALQERHQTLRLFNYRIIRYPEGLFAMDSPRKTKPQCLEQYKTLLMLTTERLHKDISSFFYKRHVNPLNCQWGQISGIIDELWNAFATLNSYPRGGKEPLISHFYSYLYHPSVRFQTKALLKKAIALEWSLEPSKTLLYRCGNLRVDDIVHENGRPHSLSFASSPLAGIAFDISACPLYFSFTDNHRDFYALALSEQKIKRYFYHPDILTDIYPLLAAGEFSHQRLRFYPTTIEVLEGITRSCYLDGKEYTVFNTKLKPHLSSLAKYREKIRDIYAKYLIILTCQSNAKL